MSSFTINKFDDSTTQITTKIRVTRSCMIKAMRLKVFKHGVLADGTLTLQIQRSDESLIAEKSLTYTELNQISGTYAHGFLKFEFDEQLAINVSTSSTYVELTIKILMSGHTEDSDNYISLVREENPFTSEFGDRPPTVNEATDVWFNPYGIEIYSIKRN